jgi:hypothetical protein
VNERYYQEFLARGWQASFDTHPAAEEAPLEMVLIEPRDHKNLGGVLRNMSALLPFASLTILHAPENASTLESIVYEHGKNEVKLVPHFPGNMTQDEYSHWMTTPEVWNLLTAPQVLLFQTDTAMRYNNILRFMEFDYVGAPWIWQVAGDSRIEMGNGGFSLRTRSWMSHIATTYAFHKTTDIAEDVYYAKYILDCDKAVIPDRQLAASFAVEHLSVEDPMALHKAWEFHPEHHAEYWLTQGLASPTPCCSLDLQDAWIETANGIVIEEPCLLPWMRLGLSTDGLYIQKDAKITPITTDPCPGQQKRLCFRCTINGDGREYKVALHRNRVQDTVCVWI